MEFLMMIFPFPFQQALFLLFFFLLFLSYLFSYQLSNKMKKMKGGKCYVENFFVF